jgi:hypothetical protein
MHIPSPTNGYFNATTAAMPKRHKVVIDRKRMILRSFGETSLAGGRSIISKIKSYISCVHQEEDRSIKGNRLRRQFAHGHPSGGKRKAATRKTDAQN